MQIPEGLIPWAIMAAGNFPVSGPPLSEVRRQGRGFAAPSKEGVHDESCPYLGSPCGELDWVGARRCRAPADDRAGHPYRRDAVARVSRARVTVTWGRRWTGLKWTREIRSLPGWI